MSMKTSAGPLKLFTVTTRLQATDEQGAKQRVINALGSQIDPTTITVYPFVKHSPLSHEITKQITRYEGFCKVQDATPEQIQTFGITLVHIDGHNALWICDGPEGIEALSRYYHEEQAIVDTNAAHYTCDTPPQVNKITSTIY